MTVVEVGGIELPAGDEYYFDRTEHLWSRREGPTQLRVGLDAFGQKSAGAVAYLKIKPAGRTVKKGRAFGSLEAGKYIGPLKSPVDGTIVEVNAEVLATPALVNGDPYGRGWFVIIEADDPERDLADLVHGIQAVRTWLREEYDRYVAEGLFAE